MKRYVRRKGGGWRSKKICVEKGGRMGWRSQEICVEKGGWGWRSKKICAKKRGRRGETRFGRRMGEG